MTTNPHPATAIISSETAVILQLKKVTFDAMMSQGDESFSNDLRERLTFDVISRVPILQGLNAVMKKKLIDSMSEARFPHGTYICQQGAAGNTFYVIKEGGCRVTITKDGGLEKDVQSLKSGDFFGIKCKQQHNYS